MLYNAMDVACFIINYHHKHNLGIQEKYKYKIEMTNRRVQNLLYFVQANSFIRKDKPFFKEDMEAWAYGSTVPEVYDELSRFVSWEIPPLYKYQRLDKKGDLYKTVYYHESIFSEEDKNIMIEVIEAFKDEKTLDIIDLIQKQTPFINSYVPNERDVIPLYKIKFFFCEDKKKDLENRIKEAREKLILEPNKKEENKKDLGLNR